MANEYYIERFYPVQRDNYDIALKEIKSGRKQTHWMWFIFPQLKTLGRSYNSFYYGIENAEEAKQFYDDRYLGGNLREICRAILECESDAPLKVLGFPDNLKLQSSMTLFYLATGDELFKAVLEKFYNGKYDDQTLAEIAPE